MALLPWNGEMIQTSIKHLPHTKCASAQATLSQRHAGSLVGGEGVQPRLQLLPLPAPLLHTHQ